jgi:hypothetical protein
LGNVSVTAVLCEIRQLAQRCFMQWPEDCTADSVRSSSRRTRIIVREMRPNSVKLTPPQPVARIVPHTPVSCFDKTLTHNVSERHVFALDVTGLCRSSRKPNPGPGMIPRFGVE